MKEIGILMSAPMVLATLEDRKTVTRRIVTPHNIRLWTNGKMVKPSPELLAHAFLDARDFRNCDGTHIWKARPFSYQTAAAFTTWMAACTFGDSKDRLWVKETFIKTPQGIAYDADGHAHFGAGGRLSKTPSIFMRREYSRIVREIASVRIERLQEITEDDAIAEGLTGQSQPEGTLWSVPGVCSGEYDPRAVYAMLWESINGTGSWHANPYVWRIEFKRIEQP